MKITNKFNKVFYEMHTKIYIQPLLTRIQMLDSDVFIAFPNFFCNIQQMIVAFSNYLIHNIAYQIEELSNSILSENLLKIFARVLPEFYFEMCVLV